MGQLTAGYVSQQFSHDDDAPMATPSTLAESLDIIRQFRLDDQEMLLLYNMRRALQTALLVSGIAGVLLITFITHQITRPLGQLHEAAQSLAKGDLQTRVPISSRDEVGRVAATFNYLAEQLQTQQQLHRKLVADVAHELRTPITVLQSDLEAMLDDLLVPTKDELAGLHGEVRHLSRIIEDLRLLSLADAKQLTMYPESVDVCLLMQQLADRFDTLANEQQIDLCCEIPAYAIVALADADRIQQAVVNLLDNAIQHTPNNGFVSITVTQEEHDVQIAVADSGLGIPAADLPFVFERFWRGEPRKFSPGHQGHRTSSGLGLSIVKHIVELHGGTVEFSSPPGNGAVFTITLPLIA